ATFSFRDEALNSSSLAAPGSNGRPAYQSRYLHGVLNGPMVLRKLFTSLSLEHHGEDHGATLVQALTPTGLISQRVETGQADQVFNNRLQYEISSRNTLNVNARYQTL